jgi:glucose-6-phosphate 1-dehydrogenase
VDNKRWSGVPFDLEAGKGLDRSEVFIEVFFKNVNASLKFFVSSNKGVSYDAYEKVFYDCLVGDQTLFTTTGEIMGEWRLVADIIKSWKSVPLSVYEKGMKGEDIR